MNGKIALALLVAVAAVSGLPKPEPQWPFGRPIGRKIVGGEEATPHQYPWIVDMRRGGHYCGGSIINEEWVVTAAHCSTASASNYELVAGDHNINTPDPQQQNRQVVRVVRHPSYGNQGLQYQYDIALMQVSPPFELNEFVQPVNLPPLGLQAPSTLTVAGWGALSQGGGSPAVLHHVDVPFVNEQDCLSSYPGSISEDMICAGEAGLDSCQGDSGGPLTCEVDNTTYLCGIVSWGRGCAQAGYPGVYTETSFFTEWVNSAIIPEPEDNSTFVVQDEGCGGSLVGSSGQVSFTVEDGHEGDISCIWSLRTKDQSAIRVELYDLSTNAEDRLTVTELNTENGRVLRTTQISEPGVLNVTGPVILLAFESAAHAKRAGEGFRLHFYGTGSSESTGLNHNQAFLGDDTGSFSYPVDGGDYQSDELVTVVVNPSSSKTLTVNRIDLEASGTCSFDVLNIASLSGGEITHHSSVCGTSPPPPFSQGGPYVLTLRTDYSVERTGFGITWA